MRRVPIFPYAREARLRVRLWNRYAVAAAGELWYDEPAAVDVLARIHASGNREMASYKHPQNWTAFDPPLTSASRQPRPEAAP